MPRQSRIDAPGALHHIIARGNEKRKIFPIPKQLAMVSLAERLEISPAAVTQSVVRGERIAGESNDQLKVKM
jgi:hypothetical protein